MKRSGEVIIAVSSCKKSLRAVQSQCVGVVFTGQLTKAAVREKNMLRSFENVVGHNSHLVFTA